MAGKPFHVASAAVLQRASAPAMELFAERERYSRMGEVAMVVTSAITTSIANRLGERMPRRPRTTGQTGPIWERIKGWFTDYRTWTTMLYMLLQLPLGITYFTIMATGLATSPPPPPQPAKMVPRISAKAPRLNVCIIELRQKRFVTPPYRTKKQ